MNFIRNRQEFEHTLILMHQEGRSIRDLSRQFHLGRNTVRRILRAHAQRRDRGHERLTKRLTRASKLDGFAAEIKRLLEKYPNITGLRIYEELKEMGYPGGISILRERLKKWRVPVREPVIRFETEPGRQGQMDWSPYTIPFARSGKCQVQCFSYILGFSRRQYIDFTTHHDFYSLIRRHQDAFQYYGGVPKECLYDNEKTVVLRWECGRPVFNPAFTAFITHYECKPIACRPGRPETKGKIEAPFQYVEGNLLNGRDFHDLEDLRSRARWWLKEKSDLHIHDTTRRAPLDLFARETLQPLPLHPYDSSEVALRICNSDGLIEFETNHYSVPSEHIADILSLKATEQEIRIYSPEIELIARHERYPAGLGKRVENPDHFKTQRIRYGLEPVREAFLELGERAETFLKGLTEKHSRNCGFQARSILRMKEQYQSEDIHRAIEHAIRYQAFEAKAIERILRAKASPRTLESIRNDRARHELQQVLPRITQRPLDQYRELFREDKDHGGADPDQNQTPSGNPQASGDQERP
jgi:transposase